MSLIKLTKDNTMKKFMSDLAVFILMFFMSILFLKPVFSKSIVCEADNDKVYKIEIENGSHGEFIETIDWVKGAKAGLKQKLVIKDIKNPNSYDDYLQFTDGRYTITYSLRCAYE